MLAGLMYGIRIVKEGFSSYWLGYNVGFPYFQTPVVSSTTIVTDPDVVLTSGTDTLTPLPYWVAYGAPGYWPYSMSPYWYYDVPWYGPMNYPWTGPSPWGLYGREHYRPGHGPGYSGVAGGGFGGGGGGGGHH